MPFVDLNQIQIDQQQPQSQQVPPIGQIVDLSAIKLDQPPSFWDQTQQKLGQFGRGIVEQARKCGECGQVVEPADRYCRHCGAAFGRNPSRVTPSALLPPTAPVHPGFGYHVMQGLAWASGCYGNSSCLRLLDGA